MSTSEIRRQRIAQSQARHNSRVSESIQKQNAQVLLAEQARLEKTRREQKRLEDQIKAENAEKKKNQERKEQNEKNRKEREIKAKSNKKSKKQQRLIKKLERDLENIEKALTWALTVKDNGVKMYWLNKSLNRKKELERELYLAKKGTHPYLFE